MSKISEKETKPEILVRRYLFSKGFRYRKITTIRKTGGLHLAYKARVSSRDLSPQLSLTFKPIAV